MSNKIKSLFYESPKPIKLEPVKTQVVIEPPVRNKVKAIIAEGVLFGAGPKLYGTGQSSLSQSEGGGGGYAGPICVAKEPGETQFGIIEAEGEESLDDMIDAEISKDETPPPKETKDDTKELPTEDAPVEPEITPESPVEPQETPEQKVTKMFADSGDVDVDYSLTNENNIRLEKFKYVNVGLDLKKLIPEDDLKSGISSKDVMNLLTPSQRDMLRDKNRELRKTYPLMDKREKNIIIHNSNVPIYNANNELSTDMKRQAYDKINAYLETNFGKNWQDKSKAINFLRTIKINFSNAPAIRANLIDIGAMVTEEGENYKIPLDKVNVMVPSLVHEFIKSNKEDPIFVRSNIFRTLTSVYNQESGSMGQVYVIFNSQNLGEGDIKDQEESKPEEVAAETTPTKGESPEATPEATSETPTEATPEATPETPEATPEEEGLDNAVPPLPVK
jgi:hypothetical protein